MVSIYFVLTLDYGFVSSNLDLKFEDSRHGFDSFLELGFEFFGLG